MAKRSNCVCLFISRLGELVSQMKVYYLKDFMKHTLEQSKPFTRNQYHSNQSTISRDIKVLKESAQQFVYDLTKSDLAYYYKQSIDGIEEAKKESWKICNDQTVPMREKLLALKLIILSDETRFKLLSEGPGLLAVKSLEDRLNRIERMGEQRQISR